MNNKAALEFDKLIGIIIAIILLGIIVGFLVLGLSGMLDDIGGFGSGAMDSLNDSATDLGLSNEINNNVLSLNENINLF